MTMPHVPADVTRQLEFAQQLLDRTRNLQAQLAELTGSGEALGGWVRASVDHAGRPVGLTLEPRIMRRASEEVAEAVLAAFADAHDDLTRRSGELATQMRDELPEQLRDPVGSGAVDDLVAHGRDLAHAMQTSNDPSGDALRLAENLRARVLRGI